MKKGSPIAVQLIYERLQTMCGTRCGFEASLKSLFPLYIVLSPAKLGKAEVDVEKGSTLATSDMPEVVDFVVLFPSLAIRINGQLDNEIEGARINDHRHRQCLSLNLRAQAL